MRVAVTVWENRISPVFDSANMLMIAQVEENEVIERSYEQMNTQCVDQVARALCEKNVNQIICGAVSEESAFVLEKHGIELIPFLAGEIELVLDRYIKGKPLETFVMPGCFCRCKKCKMN